MKDPKLIQIIQSCPRISPLDKEKAVKEIRRIAKKGLVRMSDDKLERAFAWFDSRLGWAFWHDINKKLNQE